MLDGREQRGSRISAVFAMLTLWSISGAQAAVITTYNPSVAFGYARTGDVTYFGTGESDDSWNAFVSLPWSRRSDNVQTALSYRGRYTSYQTFKSLNDLAHYASAYYSREFSPRTRLGLTARFSRGQDQGNPFQPSSGNSFLAQRTLRTLAGVGVSLDRSISRRWTWNIGADAQWARFDPIEDFDPGSEAPPVENGQSYSIVTGMSRSVSERSSVGGSYRFGIIQKETAPDERGHVLSLDYSRKVRSKGTFGVSVGGFKRTRIDVEDDSDYRNSGAFVSLNLGFGDELEVGPFQFRFDLGGGPTLGGGLFGTATEYYAGVTVVQSDFRPTTKWRWSFGARYSYRQPSDRDFSDTASASIAGSVERQFIRQLSARADYRWVEQQQQDDDLAATGSYSVIIVGLVWYPLGGSRTAGGR